MPPFLRYIDRLLNAAGRFVAPIFIYCFFILDWQISLLWLHITTLLMLLSNRLYHVIGEGSNFAPQNRALATLLLLGKKCSRLIFWLVILICFADMRHILCTLTTP